MWIVRLALRRPYTFVVMSLAILLLGVTSIVTMPIDIFPYIDMPVISIVWNYSGISPEEMENRILTQFERGMTTIVNDIEHIESQSYYGVSVIHVYFQPKAKSEMAMAQLASQAQSATRGMPPGIFPPSILKYDASSVPILQLGLESKTLSEQEIYDLAQNFIRTPLATVQGASIPGPYGGKQRQIVIDLDPKALYAKQLSAIDVSNAVNAQSLILPAGNVKIGDREYSVRLNSSPEILADLNNLPMKTVNGATVYLNRAGWILGSNQYRPDQRDAGRVAHHPAERAGIHAGHRQQGEGRPAENRGLHAARTEDTAALRPVPVRARSNQRRSEGGRDCRNPHRSHDPSVSGKLAQHRDCVHLDSAFHSYLAHHSESDGSHHQRDDARRPGARRGNSGG
jgi:multidrug efflux pump subunit AcrB